MQRGALRARRSMYQVGKKAAGEAGGALANKLAKPAAEKAASFLMGSPDRGRERSGQGPCEGRHCCRLPSSGGDR
jgi:hypothetical protein